MRKILTLSLLLICLGGFAQKINLALNLKQDSTYYLNIKGSVSMTEYIDNREHIVNLEITTKVAHKVIAIKDTVYQMEVKYLTLGMHIEVEGKVIDVNSDNASESIYAKIAAAITNKPFALSISNTGKVLEMQNMDNIYVHMFDGFPQITEAQKAQFVAQMDHSFGPKAFKNSFQTAFAMFPQKQVGPNDKWVTNTSVGDTATAISAQVKTTYTLQRESANDILIKGNAEFKPNGATNFKLVNGIPMRFKNIAGSSTAEITLDKSTCWIKDEKTMQQLKGTVEAQSSSKTPGGLTFPVSVTTDITTSSNAQNVKPKFKEITLVAYRPNDSTKNLAVTINIYYHINADGIIHIIMNKMNGLNYTGVVRDTTYKLADDIISTLNTVFNGERKLSSYKVNINSTEGTSLLVPAIFMSYVAVNGAIDEMVFSQDFFGYDMNGTLNKIIFARQARVERNTGVYRNNALEAKILNDHLSCKCIPAVEAPPRVKHLEIKN